MYETEAELAGLQALLDESLAGASEHRRAIIRPGERTLTAAQLVKVITGMSTLAVSSANAAQVSDICSRVTQCVVVLFSGRPLIINTQLNQADAFVAAWLPGTEGAGITDVLFGDFSFTGKLPVTWPNAVTQEPINSGDGQTGLFPFGYGITP